MPKVLFVADKFSEETRSDREAHPGGAELTDAAAIAACPWPLEARRFSDLDLDELDRFDLIVVGNSQRAGAEQLARIAATGRHVLFEHDVRICIWNGNFPSSGDVLHKSFQRCWCPHPALGELFSSARGVVFLTARQREVYLKNPFFACARDAILGCSLFSRAFFERVERFASVPRHDKHGAAVVYSPNAIKGYEPSRRWASAHIGEVREIRNASPEQVLEAFASADSLVYLPIGLEPAGRLPVEARLLGCDVIVNDNVGVSGESWWRGTRSDGIAWLSHAPRRFWELAERFLEQPAEPAQRELGAAAQAGLDWVAKSTRYTRWLARPLPPLSPRVLRRTRSIERHTRW